VETLFLNTPESENRIRSVSSVDNLYGMGFFFFFYGIPLHCKLRPLRVRRLG
jgi:hypothetical protein